MTIKEAFWNQEGKEVRARVLRSGSSITLGLRTPEGLDSYEESIDVRDSDTIDVLRQTLLSGRRGTKDEWRTLVGEAINDEGLTRDADVNLVSHIVWEASKPQEKCGSAKG